MHGMAYTGSIRVILHLSVTICHHYFTKQNPGPILLQNLRQLPVIKYGDDIYLKNWRQNNSHAHSVYDISNVKLNINFNVDLNTEFQGNYIFTNECRKFPSRLDFFLNPISYFLVSNQILDDITNSWSFTAFLLLFLNTSIININSANERLVGFNQVAITEFQEM